MLYVKVCYMQGTECQYDLNKCPENTKLTKYRSKKQAIHKYRTL